MHSLEVIIRRNEEAAGREMAHRVNDALLPEQAINEAGERWEDSTEPEAYARGYTRGREES
jgi:hypothetical protein